MTWCYYNFFFVTEPPSLTAQPKSKIFGELDRNAEIPCLAAGTHEINSCMYKVVESKFVISLIFGGGGGGGELIFIPVYNNHDGSWVKKLGVTLFL